MEERFEEHGHGLQRPHHWDGIDARPEGFVPLHLEIHPLDDDDAEVRTLQLTCPIAVIGRHSEADICLAFADVSRRHCRLAFHDGVWHIGDLNSLNGLYVNGERTHEAVLHEGDQVRMGSVAFVVLSNANVPAHPWNQVLRSIANNLE